MKYDNQLRYAANIIREYDGSVPLSAWLKDFFKQNKQMGSRDRKTVSGMVYGFYRLGHNQFGSIEERILSGISLLNTLPELK
jgi:16S rRNA (cytosine967-C5)-methyltransferase